MRRADPQQARRPPSRNDSADDSRKDAKPQRRDAERDSPRLLCGPPIGESNPYPSGVGALPSLGGFAARRETSAASFRRGCATNHAAWALRVNRLCVIAFVAWVTAALAGGAPEAFEQANQLYERGQFTEAAAAYESLLRSGSASPALFFNLGNAYFKSGQVGRALFNYRRAEALAPRDPDIRANLQFARDSVPGHPARSVDRWTRWLPRLTLNETAGITALALWGWLGLLTLRLLRPALRRSLRAATYLAGFLALFLAAWTAATWEVRRAGRTAIVVAPEATAHFGPLEESPAAFPVRNGFELPVTDTKGDWFQVTDAAHRTGWLRREQVVLFPLDAPGDRR